MINYSDKQIKEKKLLNKLTNKIANDLSIDKLKLRIKNQESVSFQDISYIKSLWTLSDKTIISHSLNLNLIGVKNRARYGYSDAYYSGRKEKLSFVLHNRKLSRNFILLHELSHAYLIRLSFKHNRPESYFNKEKNADRLAIFFLKRYGQIKANKE